MTSDIPAEPPPDLPSADERLSQFWYSPATIQQLLPELTRGARAVASLSVPSLFLALPPSLRAASRLFEFDPRFRDVPGFVPFDFRTFPTPADRPWRAAFDVVIADPPYLRTEVWAAYIRAIRYVLAPGGRVLVTTLPRFAPQLARGLGVRAVAFRPHLPTLPYQYDLLTNYASPALDLPNPELATLAHPKVRDLPLGLLTDEGPGLWPRLRALLSRLGRGPRG